MPRSATTSADGTSVARLALLVLVAYLICVGAKLSASHFDITKLIVAGDEVVSSDRLQYHIAVEAHSPGYDGQYFYRMALAPLDFDPNAFGISMHTHPEVRAQRIVYPIAAWALCFGQGQLVPYSLVAINLIAIVVLALIAMQLARASGLHPTLGLLIPLYPGFVLSICRDTAEIIATALALGGVLAATKARWPIAAMLASIAVLTRESTLLYLAGFGVIATLQTVKSRSLDPRAAWCLCPLVVYLIWQVAVKAVWGTYSYEVVGHDDFSPIPLTSYLNAVLAYLSTMMSGPLRYSVVYAVMTSVGFTGLLLVFAYSVARSRRADYHFVFPLTLYTLMAVLFSEAVWRDPWGYVRILNDFYVFGVVSMMGAAQAASLKRLAPFIGVVWVASVAYSL